MSPIVANRPRYVFPLKSFSVGVVVMVGKVESNQLFQSFRSCVADNVLSVSICRGHDTDWLPIVITDRRRPLQSYGNQALL